MLDAWKKGMDKTVTLIDAEDNVTKIAINSGGHGKVYPYGPVCHVNGVEVPCLCSISPHGGVTGEILTDTLRHLDKLGVYKDRGVNGNPSKPCLLLDGHSSRFELPFLRYIDDHPHGNDPGGTGHLWGVCIGVPYGKTTTVAITAVGHVRLL